MRNLKQAQNGGAGFFSSREKRGILWLLPLLAVITVIIVVARRVESSPNPDEYNHLESDGGRSAFPENSYYENRRGYSESKRQGYGENSRDYGSNRQSYSRNSRSTLPEPQPFDPNTLSADEFEKLGFSPRQATVLINYRTARGGFRTADDFGKSFVVSEAMMARLRPYIVINKQNGGREVMPEAGRAVDDSGATEANSAAKTSSDLSGDSAQSSDNATYGSAAHVTKKMLEINSADSAALRMVRGIGNVLVVRILDYRARLGGFARKEQLLEIPGMMHENFVRICEQILVDSAKIRKINVNFAPADVLGKHPYVTAAMLRKLLKNRQLKGGWRSTHELVEQNIVTEDQAARLDPYLVFER